VGREEGPGFGLHLEMVALGGGRKSGGLRLWKQKIMAFLGVVGVAAEAEEKEKDN